MTDGELDDEYEDALADGRRWWEMPPVPCHRLRYASTEYVRTTTGEWACILIVHGEDGRCWEMDVADGVKDGRELLRYMTAEYDMTEASR